MNDITNQKIRGLAPLWTSFRGFSLLFDNPGKENYTPGKDGMFEIYCQADHQEIELYKQIDDIRKKMLPSLPSNDYLLCPLPIYSFHVTAWDGANIGNLKDFKPESKTYFKNLFDNYPVSMKSTSSEVSLIKASKLVTKTDWGLRFKFKSLESWNNKALVILLEPADDKAEEILTEIEALRKELNILFQEQHGFSRGIREIFLPHISIAYFANETYGQHFQAHLEYWNNTFRETLNQTNSRKRTITFNSISLYGFLDMVTFFKYMP